MRAPAAIEQSSLKAPGRRDARRAPGRARGLGARLLRLLCVALLALSLPAFAAAKKKRPHGGTKPGTSSSTQGGSKEEGGAKPEEGGAKEQPPPPAEVTPPPPVKEAPPPEAKPEGSSLFDTSMDVVEPTVDTPGVETSPSAPSAVAAAAGVETRGPGEVWHPFTLGGGYLQRLEGTVATLGDQLTAGGAPPGLVDLFINIQPAPEWRGYLLTRLAFDPTLIGVSSPQFLLDQLWFRYELLGQVFITIGRQQMKWGSGRVWQPTDFLRKLNPTPLEVFDLRTGTDMARIQVPVPAIGANLYAIGYLSLDGPAANPLLYGAALRAEFAVAGIGEVSFSSVLQQERKPRFGVDLNFGVGPLDVYAEAALLQDSPKTLWQLSGNTFTPAPFPGLAVQAVAGMATRVRVLDIFAFIPRLELFYNSLGYTDRRFLTKTISTGDYQPLYFGREYGMIQLGLTMRNPYEPFLAVTAIANPEDRSVFSRLDFNLNVVAGATCGAFVEVPLGDLGGEFRFVPDSSVATLAPTPLTLFRAGLWGKVTF